MNDSLRESLSYFKLYKMIFAAKHDIKPESISYGNDKEQYFYYFEPLELKSDKVIIWIHGGGWNAGSPKFYDFVGQCVAGFGYRFVSIGYRLTPKCKYPGLIEDVCNCYNAAIDYMKEKGIDLSKIVISGPSAGAHLSSILCYNDEIRQKMNVDLSGIIGYIGVGGPYDFSVKMTAFVKVLLNYLFDKNYDRALGEPTKLINYNNIPMLLIQSRHDGLVNYECAEILRDKALELGISCELYDVEDKHDTHSWYTTGMFLETRDQNKTLNKFLSWIEEL